MKDKIKSKVKKVVFPIFISVISGGICGHLVYSIYNDKTTLDFKNNLVYLLQAGAYSTYDSMRANTLATNYIYYEDDGLYKTIIGITQDKDNIEKIKNAYGKEILVNQYSINDLELCQKIGEYDKYLSKANDNGEIQEIVIAMLDLYKQDKDIQLSKIN